MAPPPGTVKVEKRVESVDDDESPPPPGSEAPFNSRVLGGLIDSVVCVALNIACHIALPNVLEFIGGLVSTAYFLTRDSLPFLGGQSIGKKAMRIKAVTLDGKSLAGNWQAGIVRNVFIFIAPVELFILWNRNEKGGTLRRLGDDYAKTKVIVVGEEGTVPTPPASADASPEA